MGPDIRQCGRAGPHTVPGGKTVWGSWAQDSLVLQYLRGRWAQQHTFPKFCLFAFVIRKMGPDIRLSPENNICFLMADKNQDIFCGKVQKIQFWKGYNCKSMGRVFCKSTCCPPFVAFHLFEIFLFVIFYRHI